MPIQKPMVTVEQIYAAVDLPRLDPDQPVVIVAPCYDVLEVTDSSNTANPNAAIAYPAYVMADVGPYVSVGGTTFTLRANNGVPQSVTLPGGGITPATLTAEVVADVLEEGMTGIKCFDIGGALLIVTETSGASSTLEITAADAAFFAGGLPPISQGASYYDNNQRSFPFAFLPDPYDRMDDLVIDPDQIDVYLLSGGSMRQLEETKALLGSADRTLPATYNHPADDYTYAMSAYNDEDGDLYTPYVVCWGDVATITTGTAGVDEILWTAAGKDHGGVGVHGNWHGDAGNYITVQVIDSGGAGPMTVVVTPAVPPAVTTVVVDLVGTGPYTPDALATAIIADGSAEDYVVPSAVTLTDPGPVAVVGPTALAGGVDPLNFLDSGQVARVTGDIDWLNGPITAINAGETVIFRIDGGEEYTATMTGHAAAGAGVATAIAAELNAPLAGVFSVHTGGGGEEFLRSESPTSGVEGVVHFIGGTALPKIFGTAGVANTKYYGRAFPAVVGDSLWYQGSQVALVAAITPLLVGSQSFTGGLMKISTEININTSYSKWYMVAEDGVGTVGRPTPEVTIDGTNDEVRIRQAAMYDADGNPYLVAIYPTYVAYKALRLDVTQAATTHSPTLLAYSGLTELAADQTLTSDNPLGLGMMKAMAIAPENTIYGLGVDEVTDAEPEGTYLGYARLLDFLATRDVYFIVLYTKDEDVHVLFKNHCEAQSQSDVGKWRVVAFTEPFPTEEVPYLMGSGTGNTVVTNDQLQCDVSELNMINAILARGLNPAALTYDDGIFVRIEDQKGKWLVTSVDNVTNTATLSVSFSYPDNTDGFYEASLPDSVVSKTVALYQRGEPVTSVQDTMQALADMAGKYESRRVILAMPDECATANAEGGEERLSTFYALCDIAGTKAKSPPQEPLSGKQAETTSFVYNSNDVYPEKNGMDIAAAGGVMWFYNTAGIVRIWRQKTTDTTSIEREEVSIVSAVDYVSKYVSLALQPMLNKNIDDTYLDELGILTESVRDYLVNTKKCVRYVDVTRMEQDEDDPTIVHVDMTVVPLYPAVQIDVQLNITRSLT